MDTRKRKRILKTALPFTQYFSMRYLILCFSLLVFLVFVSGGLRFESGPFRPAPIVPHIPIFTSSASNSVQDPTTRHKSERVISSSSNSNSSSDGLFEGLRIESRVLFTDHVLVIVSNNRKSPYLHLAERIDCVYHRGELNDGEDREVTVTHLMTSADEYGEGRWVVRCPAPPSNYSAAVGLQGHRGHVAGVDWQVGMTSDNQTVKIWDMVAYEAVLDGEDMAVVFVKGLHLRSDRESDPNPFVCQFRKAGNSSYALTTKAITAAQEVIRCPLPPELKTGPRNDEEVQITVATRRARNEVVPSIARLYNSNKNDNKMNKGSYQYELCACTMVWNQAALIKEWIIYHGWLGVQRWFVYDNNSNDGLKEVINELNGENYNVSRHAWPWVKSQEAGFSHCVLRARDECKWVAFFDVDEFYYFGPPKQRRNSIMVNPGPDALRAVVRNVSSSSPTVGEIRTDCHSFGPSGLKKRPVEGQTLGYTCRLRSPERHKSIVRPDAVDDSLLNQVHHFKLKSGFKRMNFHEAVINHYKYQVWDVFKAKFYRRVSTYVADWQENQNENSRDRAPGLGTEAIEPPNWHLRFCEVWDTRLRDFVIANLADSNTGLLPWQRSVQ